MKEGERNQRGRPPKAKMNLRILNAEKQRLLWSQSREAVEAFRRKPFYMQAGRAEGKKSIPAILLKKPENDPQAMEGKIKQDRGEEFPGNQPFCGS